MININKIFKKIQKIIYLFNNYIKIKFYKNKNMIKKVK